LEIILIEMEVWYSECSIVFHFSKVVRAWTC